MVKAVHWEPYEPRGSRTVLGARGGVIPLRDSLAAVSPSEIYAREGVELERSRMADWVGGTSQLLAPLVWKRCGVT